ncbi:cAMP-dependent protein kinase catalytic subunit [Trametes pubescens]|uniref:non-specific serine/threonine protein kinase n=1 Tax=Trametes pubescens TaxID=154538 RepID=A0A1M2VWW8_TRAPU|nr:cAMP-dependent protein kinase catalytic subunit [Trametes pubescens]
MAPLRRLREMLEEQAAAQFTAAIDSGFVSGIQSRESASQRPATAATSELNANGKRKQVDDLATTGHKRRRPSPLALRDIEAVRAIGAGGWGSVHVARVKRQSAHPLDRPGATFALKAVGKVSFRDLERNDKGSNQRHAVERRNAERNHLNALPWNPFIAGLVDVHTDLKNTYLTLEYGACGTLYTHMRDLPSLTDREIKFYFANLVLAIEFLHTHNIVHCDIKPENLVLGADGYLLLTDFGLAQTLHSNTSWNRMGTLDYMSPETLSREPLDSVEKRAAADWWAAAVSLFEMKTHCTPFECDSEAELKDKHKNSPLVWPPGVKAHPSLEGLLFRMLHYDLPHRLGATEVPEGKDGSMINREIRRHEWMKSINWDRIERKIATAPRVPNLIPDEDDRIHNKRFPEQSKVPGLPLKRPSPRLEWYEIKTEKEPSPRKKRRMSGQYSMCLPPGPLGPPLPRSPSMAVERGSIVVEA